MTKKLGRCGLHVNKKKVQRLIRKLSTEIRSFTRKSRRYNSYRGKIGMFVNIQIHRRFYTSICYQKITAVKFFLSGISEKPSTLAIMEAIEEAICVTEDCIYRRTFHSDQG